MENSDVKSEVVKILKPIFTKTQISALISGKTVHHWPEEDIAAAITLRSTASVGTSFCESELAKELYITANSFKDMDLGLDPPSGLYDEEEGTLTQENSLSETMEQESLRVRQLNAELKMEKKKAHLCRNDDRKRKKLR
ncbi:hypothetical protein Pmani_013404 [Petrolisthes manimaculis]|uniref:Uncharacterized protein n=1 Tax=Petrolisthes manimaculis TaxID=1843537 RepID=A0AAE1PW85_9EUCA|nr:hypothetical protein Pmani_013404 [Petrolisthes manimaculis]